MARVFVTGSSTGLGSMAAQLLLELGHRVVVHGRNQARADIALAAAPRADAAVIGDLSKIRDMRAVAEQVNQLGEFDAVIHNAGIGYRGARRLETVDRLPALFATNTLAPYVLTALIERPKRLVTRVPACTGAPGWISDDLTWARRAWRWSRGVCGNQVARRADRVRCSTAMARRALQCARARLGGDQDGRCGRPGYSG